MSFITVVALIAYCCALLSLLHEINSYPSRGRWRIVLIIIWLNAVLAFQEIWISSLAGR
jgi:hypothetical protein